VADSVAASQVTTSLTYADLSTVGPAVTLTVPASGTLQRASASSVLSGLTPGSTTFTGKYKREGGGGSATCTFVNRSIMAIPLP